MAPRYVYWNLICILGLLSCRTSQNLTHPTSTGAPSSASAISPSSDTTTCVAFLSLAAPTQEELRWQPLNGATVPFSTRTYGTHTALQIQTQFIGDFLVYTVSSVSQMGDVSNGCVSTATGKTPTGDAVIPNLCPGVYRLTLSACTTAGVCSAPTDIPTPYLQDSQRNPDIQQAVAQVATAKSDLDQLSQKAFDTITTYYQTYATAPSPTPTRKTLLDMAQKVQNMGLGMYQNILFSDYASIKNQVQNGLALASSSELQQQVSEGRLPITASGCISTQQTVSEVNTKALGLADTSSGTQQADATVMQGLGSAFLVIGGIGFVGLTYTGYQAHQREVIEAARVQAEEKARITQLVEQFKGIVREKVGTTFDVTLDAIPSTVDSSVKDIHFQLQGLSFEDQVRIYQQIQLERNISVQKLTSLGQSLKPPLPTGDGEFTITAYIAQPNATDASGKPVDGDAYRTELPDKLFGDLRNPQDIFIYKQEITFYSQNGKIQIIAKDLTAPPLTEPQKTEFRTLLSLERTIQLSEIIHDQIQTAIWDKNVPIKNSNEKTRIMRQLKSTLPLPETKLSLKSHITNTAKKSAGESVLEVGTTVLLGAMLIVGAVLVGVGSSLADAATPETTLLQTLDTWIPMLEAKFAVYSQAQTTLALATSHTGS